MRWPVRRPTDHPVGCAPLCPLISNSSLQAFELRGRSSILTPSGGRFSAVNRATRRETVQRSCSASPPASDPRKIENLPPASGLVISPIIPPREKEARIYGAGDLTWSTDFELSRAKGAALRQPLLLVVIPVSGASAVRGRQRQVRQHRSAGATRPRVVGGDDGSGM